jgi:hypothetical protein
MIKKGKLTMLAAEQVRQLSEALENARQEIVTGVVAELAANPYWADRFGDRGLQFIQQDCQAHMDTLISSIQIDQPGFMPKHYKWLQGVLVHRGLCSRHLYETISAFDRQISEKLPGFWSSIHPFQLPAYAGLAYEASVCRALAHQEEHIAARAAQRICSENLEWTLRLGVQGEALCLRENRYYLSFLQDALGWQNPQLFTDYLAWFSSYKEARRIMPQMLNHALAYQAEEIKRLLPEAEAQQAVELIEASLSKMS